MRVLGASALAALVLATPRMAFARSDGVQSFGCTGCHGGGDHRLELEFDPAEFEPGDTVTLRLGVTDASGVSFGFYLGASSGEFLPKNGISGSARGIAHTEPLPYESEGAFTVEWVAPDTPGPVRFELASVVANGNGNRNGDEADEAVFERVFGCEAGTFFRDVDQDGFGNPQFSQLGCVGSPPDGTVANADDCDDFDASQNPSATELCNRKDDDCDGSIDEDSETTTLYPDRDNDGYYSAEEQENGTPIEGCLEPGFAAEGGDCAPDDPNRNPGVEETCNRVDDDCDGRIDERTLPICGVGLCRREAFDCAGIFCAPGDPIEEQCNGIDDDCDGETDESGCAAGSRCIDAECVSDEPVETPETPAPPLSSASGCTGTAPILFVV
ncbi:MAG: choice-of-anchor V domain-containing protein, partial [Myxococcota bacterium]